MLDAGHGGSSSGAAGFGKTEKELVLTLAKYMATLFQTAGVDVVLTRETDRYMTLKERTDLECKVKPDCFISLHMDGATESAQGCTVWLHSKAPQSYVKWANDIVSGVDQYCSSNRSAKVNKGYRGNPNENYAVNRDTNCPSCLVEYGFITNATNCEEMVEHYQDYAMATVKATCRFLGIEQPKPSKVITIEQLALELKNKGIESIKIGG